MHFIILTWQLNSNLEDLEQLLPVRIKQYKDKLQKATSAASLLQLDLASLSNRFSEFKGFVWQVLNKIRTQLVIIIYLYIYTHFT